jgi:hypothetical protein
MTVDKDDAGGATDNNNGNVCVVSLRAEVSDKILLVTLHILLLEVFMWQ